MHQGINHSDIIKEELERAIKEAPQYLRSFLVTPENSSSEAHYRASLQTQFRLAMARIAVAEIFDAYEQTDKPPYAALESENLKLLIFQRVLGMEFPVEQLAEYTRLFEIDLSTQRDMVIEEIEFPGVGA